MHQSCPPEPLDRASKRLQANWSCVCPRGRNQTWISPATFAASASNVGWRMGGVAATRDKRETSRRIWCEAMSELEVPAENWMSFSEENF